MSSPQVDEVAVEAELQVLQRKLGKKLQFEEAVAAVAAVLLARYAAASPSLRRSIYSTVCRVATVLQSRYTNPGFWLAGLNLFVEAESLVTDSSQKEHLKGCISKAREFLHGIDNEDSMPSNREADSRYLFEGHLTVGPEPPPPAWLVAQNFLSTLSATQEISSIAGSSGTRDEDISQTESRSGGVPPAILDFINSMASDVDLATVIEESLQGTGVLPHKQPPASKEVVANLPVVTVTEEIIARLGSETQCAVCRENLVVDDKMQELPCQHLFHPPCLKPWLDEHNSCPVCRHELRTDDHAYEGWKEREREAEEERKGAANAVRGGEFMYI